MRFVVTSLSTGQPVAGAKVESKGSASGRWATLAAGNTGGDGSFTGRRPGRRPARDREVRRIVVDVRNDLLVLDPTAGPTATATTTGRRPTNAGCNGPSSRSTGRGPQPEDLCHIFTERPVYRPEEEVHIKGYLRHRERGDADAAQLDGSWSSKGRTITWSCR